MPDYLASDPRFGDMVRQYFAEQDTAEDGPYERLLTLKACMVAVSGRLRAELRRAPPTTAGARLGCALRAWRAWRTGRHQHLEVELARMPSLRSAARQAIARDLVALRATVCEVGAAEAAEYLESSGRASRTSGDGAQHDVAAVARSRRRAALWAPRGRQVRLIAARGGTGGAMGMAATLKAVT